MFKDAMWCVTFCVKGKFQNKLPTITKRITYNGHVFATLPI